MCGIIGYAGNRPAVPLIVEGLRRLEYRGYDSAGVGFVQGGRLNVIKAEGRLAALEEKLAHCPNTLAVTGIGHTRWATHGAPVERNAHPHCGGRSGQEHLAIIHNGIIENYQELKADLLAAGYEFRSETDTEVLAHLIAEGRARSASFLEGFAWALRQARGAYAVAVVTEEEPSVVYAARMSAPLILGVGVGEHFVASDIPAFLPYTRDVVFLQDGEIVRLTDHSWEVLGLFDLAPREKKRSDHSAGLWGRHLLEQWAGVPVTVEIASEFRYGEALFEPGEMAIAISQSGETADTLAALRLVREKGCPVIGLCNVVGSSIAREADAVIYTQAGPEIRVASTKAMCSQMVLLALLALYYAQRRAVPGAEAVRADAFRVLRDLPDILEAALPAMRETAQRLARAYASAGSFFFLGRGPAYPLALEGALKLKELSYIHAEGYAAGEMKHGPIALIEPDFPTFAVALSDNLFPKAKSNIIEVQARRGPVIALINPGVELGVEEPWVVPAVKGPLAGFVALPAMQLFSYEMADALGKDVDQPRNLAKSVTVE